MHGPDRQFWQQRFEAQNLPWDRGEPGPQLQHWLANGLIRPGDRVAVPGCGSGHEVLALARAGVHVIGLDYAPAAVAQARQRLLDAGMALTLRPPSASSQPGPGSPADDSHATPASSHLICIEEADVLLWQPPAPLDVVYEQTCFCALHPDRWAAYARQLQRWLRPGGKLLLLAMQCQRPGAAEGRIEGPPYHMDIHMVRSHLVATEWDWPAPPYPQIPHPRGWQELALELTRR